MQNNMEADFTQKLYKKKLEEYRKLSRSIGKFKKLYKIKNQDLDNLSDKRFKDIVDAYKRTHNIEKKGSVGDNKISKGPMKRSRSICLDNVDNNHMTIFDKNFNGINSNDNEAKRESGISNGERYKFQTHKSKFGNLN